MNRLLPFVLILGVSAELRAAVVDVAPERGRAVRPIEWTDDTGRERQLSEFAGYPLILLPMYTRCRGACVRDVEQIKQALANSAVDQTQFRVLLFSFDPTDRPAVLAKYRIRENIPLSWSIGTATPANIDALLESIGTQVGKAGAEFTHPNLVVFLDPNLRIAKWIYGTDYSTTDADRALKIAMGRSDWIGRHSDFLYAILLFSASALCVALVFYMRQLNQVRRSSRRRVAAVSG